MIMETKSLGKSTQNNMSLDPAAVDETADGAESEQLVPPKT